MKLLFLAGPAGLEARLRAAAAAARSLTRQGYSVTPWMPGASGEEAARALAILADACRLFPDDDFALPGAEPPAACLAADLTLALAPAPPGQPLLSVAEDPAGLDLVLPNAAASCAHPLVDPLLPAFAPEVAALPAYRPGVPRYGVVSLPHIAHFSDYAILRAAEWIALPMPGRFDALFFPLTTNPSSDREWLALQGLDEWLFTQRAMGCKLYATGQPVAPHTEDLPREVLLSAEALSARLGVRFAPPLPEDHVLEALADWWDGSAAAPALLEWLAGPAPSSLV